MLVKAFIRSGSIRAAKHQVWGVFRYSTIKMFWNESKGKMGLKIRFLSKGNKGTEKVRWDRRWGIKGLNMNRNIRSQRVFHFGL